MRRDELREAMEELDFTGGEVVTTPPPSVVFSARMPAEWTEEIMAEVGRRNLKNPSQLIKLLVREGLDRAARGETHTPEVTEALRHLEEVRRTLIATDQRAA